MNFIKKSSIVILLISTAEANGQKWDLGDDFSGTDNPNGPWSYRDGLTKGLLGKSNPVGWCTDKSWAATPKLNWPFIIATEQTDCFESQSIDDYICKVKSPLLIRWTSPVSDWIRINGSLWNVGWSLCPMMWEVRKWHKITKAKFTKCR